MLAQVEIRGLGGSPPGPTSHRVAQERAQEKLNPGGEAVPRRRDCVELDGLLAKLKH